MSDVDFTPQDLALMMSVGAPKAVAKAGWSVNSLELGKACEQLGLQLTVMVKLTHGINKHGGAGLRRRGNKAWHLVHLSQLWNKERANFTLWHELAHCWQKEQWAKETGDSLFNFYDKVYKKHRYDKNPWEIHANKVANDNKEWLLLS